MHFSVMLLNKEGFRRDVTRNNLKTLMAGTTTLLLGMNVFVSPVQAAEQGQSGAALDAAQIKTMGSSNSAQPANYVVNNSEGAEEQQENNKPGIEPQSASVNGGDASTGEEKDDARLNAGIYKDKTEAHFKDDKGIEQKTTLGEVAKHLDKSNPLGVASMFHIFADKVTQNGDLNGNIAANEFSGHDFGARENKREVDHTNIDIYYIKKINQLGSNAFRNNNGSKIVVGENLVKHDENYNGGQYHVTIGGHDYTLDLVRPKDHEEVGGKYATDFQQDANYIDIKSELANLGKKSEKWMKDEATSSVTATNAAQPNEGKKNMTYDLSKAEVDNSGNNIIIQMPIEDLENANNEFTIQGLNENSKKNIIINVITPNEIKSNKDLKIYINTRGAS